MKESMEKRRCKGASSSSSSSSSASSSKGEKNVRANNTEGCTAGAGNMNNKLEKMAGWVGAGLHTAFFVSLDRCQCVKLDTLEEPILLRRPLLRAAQSDNRIEDAGDKAIDSARRSRGGPSPDHSKSWSVPASPTMGSELDHIGGNQKSDRQEKTPFGAHTNT